MAPAGTTVMVSEPVAVPVMVKPRTHIFSDVLVIDAGVAATVAAPPEIESAKSAASKSPAPPVVSYTFSLKVTVNAVLAALRLTELIVGTVLSNVQLN